MKLQYPSRYASNDGEFARYYDGIVRFELEELQKKYSGSYPEIYSKANSGFSEVRRRTDQKVMQYLINHNGVIDSWPLPFYDHFLTLSQDCKWIDGDTVTVASGLEDDEDIHVRDVPFRFVYFGDDYGTLSLDKATRTATKGRKSSELVYRHEYRKEDSARFEELEKKTRYNKIGFFRLLRDECKYLIRYAAGFFTAIVAVFCLISLLGVDLAAVYENSAGYVLSLPDPERALILVASIPVLAVLFFPFLVAMLLQSLALTNGIIASLIVLLIMAGASVAAYYLISDRMHVYHIKFRTRCQMKKSARKFAKSQEYANAMAQEEEYAQLSEQWHRAWFEYLKENWNVKI